jgi:drug efflux transport system ATP-binding protein
LGPAVEALQSAPGVLDAAVFGNALHLVVSHAESMIPQIKSYLSQRQITVTNVETIHPSLEDVFVSLTTEHDASRKQRVSS